ncbi:hypothetical protein H0W26_05740 [Candidatus Dependentiae bacterium]|nr:hypothetical protein [Candidatus Dependentiae bacterium]
MALALNLTLVVQMLHFIGAYLFISRYLLKPGYEAVKEDDERNHHIRTNIIHQQKNIAERSLRKYEQWNECQEGFMLNRPLLERAIPRIDLKEEYMQPLEPSLEDIQRAVREVSEAVKEQVLNV